MTTLWRQILVLPMLIIPTGRRTFGLKGARHLWCWWGKFNHQRLVFFRWAVWNGRATAAARTIVGVQWRKITRAPPLAFMCLVRMTKTVVFLLLLVMELLLVVFSTALAPPVIFTIVAR